MLDYSTLATSVSNPSAWAIVYSFLLSFVLGSTIALFYIKTFQGLSYSRNFLHCLVLCPILTAIAMQAIGDNVARGIGMIGTISLLRFRTNIKDPRDMFFVFASLAVGLSAGVHAYTIGVLGTICFGIAVFVLSKTPFSAGPQFDALLRFNLSNNDASQAQAEKVLADNCQNFALISLREMAQGDVLDYAYHVKMRKNRGKDELVKDLRAVNGTKNINLMMQEAIVEV